MQMKPNIAALLPTLVLSFAALASIASGEEPPDQPAPAGSVRVAGIVLKWVHADKEANFRRFEPLLREAAAGGAKMVVTTECILDGYAIGNKTNFPENYRSLAEPIPDGPYFRKLAELCEELKIHLVAGIAEADGDRIFNTAALIGPDGKLIGRYHKQQLEHEAARMTPGTESAVFSTEYGKIGAMVCADRRDRDVVKGFCARGADFLVCTSGGMSGPKDNDPILQERSKENKKYLVFVHPKEFLVTAPDGTIVKQHMLGDRKAISREEIQSEHDQNGVFYFDLPLNRP